MPLLPTLAFGENAAELELKGLRIGDSVAKVRQKATLTCRQETTNTKGSKPQSEEVRAATEALAKAQSTGYQSCRLSNLSTLGGLEVSRFDLAFYAGSLQQIIVNVHWKPPHGARAEAELKRLYKEDIAAWLQAIRQQYGSSGFTERQFRHRTSFDVLHWVYPQGVVDLTITTYYRPSDNIVLVLEGTEFSNRDKATEAMVSAAQSKLQAALAADAQRKQSERAEKIRKDLQ